MRRFERRLRHNPRIEWPDLLLQYGWFLSPLDSGKIGYGAGPLTWLRKRRHATLQRPLHLAIVEDDARGLDFGHLTAYWINERSSLCTASLNSGVEKADIVWFNAQDPLGPAIQCRFLELLDRARPDAKIINHPSRYNAYHEPDLFERLAAAGVNVPRTRFGPTDLGNTSVVYKQLGMHAASKEARAYDGPRPGHAVYEFIDARGADGRYRRYRAHYLAGAVRPSKLMRCENWNVCLKNNPQVELSFLLTPFEKEQVRRIAEVSGLNFFAVDFLRRSEDNAPFFVDINVYPTVESITHGRDLGYRGRWHTFDTRWRHGLEEPDGRPFVEVFDEAMQRLAASLHVDDRVAA
jgi:hypothetical protein